MDVSLKLILVQIFNFIILMSLLTFLYRKFLQPFMAKRAQDIKNSFEQIEKEKNEIKMLQQECARQLEDVKEKAKAEFNKAIDDSNAMREKLIDSAHKEAAAIMAQVKVDIAAEKQATLRKLHTEIAELSIKAAEKLIKAEMNEKTNSMLAEDFISSLDDVVKK